MKKSGLLLVNLGTPADASIPAVKHFLAKFLSDRRVIKTNPLIWQPFLRGIILNTRPKHSAAAYRRLPNQAGLPLLRHTLAQQQHLQKLLPEQMVVVGMSYSEPSIEAALAKLVAEKVTEITVVPMYPQYSGTTVGSVFDSVTNYFQKNDQLVDLHFIRSFYQHPLYLDYFAEKIKARLVEEPVDALVFSYHGIPVSYVADGDAYPAECTATTDLLMARIGDYPFYQTYQSKFGRAPWLTPATDVTLKKLPQQGVKKILVVTPGFIVDCLETIEEIDVENRDYFMGSGGEKFIYVPPFNADSAFAELVAELVAQWS